MTFFNSPLILSHLGIKFHNSVVSGNGVSNEEVNLIISVEQYSLPRKFDSWDPKTIDMSIFFHHSSVIPIGTKAFFNINNIKTGQPRDIKLIYNNTDYEAHFEL